jgi:hypothetical protein
MQVEQSTYDSLSADSIGNWPTSKHAKRLGHFGKALPERDDFGADRRLTIDRGIGELIDESLHRYNVSGYLLLKLA